MKCYIVLLTFITCSYGYIRLSRVPKGSTLSGSQVALRVTMTRLSALTVREGSFDEKYGKRMDKFCAQIDILKQDAMNVVTRVVVPFVLQLLFALALSQIMAIPAFARVKGKGDRSLSVCRKVRKLLI